MIALFLIISIPASIMLQPTVSAHTPVWQIPTWAYINVGPNNVGVGQTVYVVIWLRDPMIGAALTNSARFHNYNLTITAPDKTVTTKIFDVVSDPTSSQYYPYTPDQVGTYALQFSFPGQTYNFADGTAAYINDTFLPSSATTTLTVQQQPLSAVVDYPLPSAYWTRPIEGENTNWYTIASNWLGPPQINVGAGNFQPDGSAPNSSHVMWTKVLQFGGVVGGTNDTQVNGELFWTGMTYNQRFNNPLIMNGRLYYQEPFAVNGNGGTIDCVDLTTGQTIWSRTDIPMPAFGYYQDVDTPNEHGIPYEGILFTSNFARAFDARTGDPMFNVTSVPTGTSVLGPNGEILRYVMTNYGNTTVPNWYLWSWNSSGLWSYGSYPTISSVQAANISSCTTWNVTASWHNGMTGVVSVIGAFYNNVLLGRNGTLPSLTSSAPYTIWAISLKPDTLGQLLWMQNYNAPSNNDTVLDRSVDPTTRVFIEYHTGDMTFYGYNLDTGNLLWGPTADPRGGFDSYGGSVATTNTGSFTEAYGNLYISGYGGWLYCINSATGIVQWTYGNGGAGNSTNQGLETPWGYRPVFIAAIADGKVYLFSGEHSPNMPLYLNTKIRCINATDGSEIWTLTGWGSSGSFENQCGAIADGYWAYFNNYDGQIYCIGKGPSALTVTAPDAGLSFGQSVVVKGTVVDVSAGTKQNQQAADFPNGVPVASDDSMSAWMSYVYMQKPIPSNFAGVPVSIDVLDSNGNYRNIGTATTTASGTYSLSWTPDIPGNYQVVATFHGNNGYWGSYSQTAFNVMKAPAATTAPTPTPVSMAEQYFLPLSLISIIAIIVIGVLLAALILRKRP